MVATYWILTDEEKTKPYSLSVSRELTLFDSYELAQLAAAHSGSKVVSAEISNSADVFIEFLRKLKNGGTNEVLFVREGLPAITATIDEFIDRIASSIDE